MFSSFQVMRKDEKLTSFYDFGATGRGVHAAHNDKSTRSTFMKRNEPKHDFPLFISLCTQIKIKNS